MGRLVGRGRWPTCATREIVPLAALATGLLGAACGARGHLASPEAIARSFASHRDRAIGGEPILDFLRRRTATVVGGVETLAVEEGERAISPKTRLRSEIAYSLERTSFRLVLGAAAAISKDGYFLTAAHVTAAAPLHLMIERAGGVSAAPARVVWSEGGADVALLKADLEPEAWFDLRPDRPLRAGETVFAYCHFFGGAAGETEVAIDFEALGPYETIGIPHDTPIGSGFSGGPGVGLDGTLLGVHASTGMDTIFKRRGWLARASPALLERLVAEARR